jgi:DNA-binding response OmpR family regulator
MVSAPTLVRPDTFIQPPRLLRESPPLRGLLVTIDSALARAFRRQLRRAGHAVPLEVFTTLEEARESASGRYDWISVDLDGPVAPAESVRLSRYSWPRAFLAVLSYAWSDRERLARERADYVIHKPVRAKELEALFLTLADDRRVKVANKPPNLERGPRPIV